MSKLDNVSSEAEKKVNGFLSGKPIWVFWIIFTLLFGIVFGICYGVMYLLALSWWVTLLIIIVAGMATGSFMYLNTMKTIKKEDQPV